VAQQRNQNRVLDHHDDGSEAEDSDLDYSEAVDSDSEPDILDSADSEFDGSEDSWPRAACSDPACGWLPSAAAGGAKSFIMHIFHGQQPPSARGHACTSLTARGGTPARPNLGRCSPRLPPLWGDGCSWPPRPQQRRALDGKGGSSRIWPHLGSDIGGAR
jgi:hypothetical protein